MEVVNVQNFCVYCKRKLDISEDTYHIECYNETNLFNQEKRIEFNSPNFQTQLLVLLLANTSLQLQEALKITKKNIDLENRYICYNDKKFRLSESKFNELEKILMNPSFSETLFSFNVTYPSNFLLSVIKNLPC